MMRLPQRPTTHVTEAAAWKILQANAPDSWILREVTERDYGIDAYIEIATDQGEITGELISVQLKGTASINWRGKIGDRRATSPAIKTSTANYWERLPVPVFLFVADLAEKEMYFVPVEPFIRRSYEKLSSQDSISFPLLDTLRIGSEMGPGMLRAIAQKERLHRDIVFHITNLVSHAEEFSCFISANQNRDAFMEVETEAHLQFRSLYQSCMIAAKYLNIAWDIESLSEIYLIDQNSFQDEFSLLHEKTLDSVLSRIEPLLPKIVRSAVELIARTEGAYWQQEQPVLHSICASGELEWSIRALEQRLVRNSG